MKEEFFVIAFSGHIKLGTRGDLITVGGQPLPRLVASVPPALCVQCPAFIPRVLLPHTAPTEALWQTRVGHQTSGGGLALHCFLLRPPMLGLTCRAGHRQEKA